MQHIRANMDRCFVSFMGIFILFQVCLGLKDANIIDVKSDENRGISSAANPKGYFISKIAQLFANFDKISDGNIVKDINEVFRQLGIRARLLENTIRFCNGSFEFLIYIPKYKKHFLFRYTPLVENLNKLIRTEGYRLEVKILSGWMPITLDRLFG